MIAIFRNEGTANRPQEPGAGAAASAQGRSSLRPAEDWRLELKQRNKN
jgi:hypothetical protein